MTPARTSTVTSLAAVAGAAMALFVALALLVRAGATQAVDIATLTAVHTLASPALDAIMRALSLIGGGPPLVVLVCMTVVLCAWKGDRAGALTLALAGIATDVSSRGLKLLFARPRPELWPRPGPADYAFPSGHAMASVAVFGMLAIVVARALPRATPALWIAIPLFSLLIGMSRIYLGVHWPSDVLAGFAAGLMILSLSLVPLRLQRAVAAPPVARPGRPDGD